MSNSNPRCPRCKSRKVKLCYPHLECLNCGLVEPLIDYPISWDWHRYYCQEYGLPDPGPNEPEPSPELEELKQEIDNIKQELYSLSPQQAKQLKLKHISAEVKDIRQGLRRIDQIVANLVKRKRITKPKLTELDNGSSHH